MPFIDTADLEERERKPGWHGRYFDSPNMTFGHYLFDKGATLHSHSHAQEEVWNVIEGELEITVDGETQIAGPGCVAVVPPNTEHFVRALTNGKAIVVDTPRRSEFTR